MSTVESEVDAAVDDLFDDSPLVFSGILALIAGGIAVIVPGLVSLMALLAGLLGLGLFAAGIFMNASRSMVSLGTLGIFLCVLVAGSAGAPTELLLVGILGTVIAWDLGHYSIVLGRQLGRRASTRRVQVVHAATTLGVGVIVAGLAYATFTFAAANQPFPAVILLLLAVILLAWAARS